MASSAQQPVLSYPTDTVTPIAPIPIFYLHEGEHPFCNRPGCFCMAYQQQLEALLKQVISRDVKLRKFMHGMLRWEGQ